MLYADEVTQIADLEVPTAKASEPSARELAMAEQLVESLSSEFDPSKYHDDYREKVLELIERKADGEVIAAPAEPEARAPVVDLMAALEASLAAARSGKDASKDASKDAGKDATANGASKASKATKASKAAAGKKAAATKKAAAGKGAGTEDEDAEERETA
jgi:DNA end-binding protein Ku